MKQMLRLPHCHKLKKKKTKPNHLGGFFFFVLKEVPLFGTFPIPFFQHPVYPGREEAPHSNQNLTVPQECYQSVPPSVLSVQWGHITKILRI